MHIVLAVLGIGLVALGSYYLINKINGLGTSGFNNDEKLKEGLKELREKQQEMIEAFNQNAETYNRTKNKMVEELKLIGEWNVDASKYLDVLRDNCVSVTSKVNEHVDDIKELQDELILKKKEVASLEKEVSRLRKVRRGKRVVRTNYHY